MERKGGDVDSLLEEVVVDIGICTSLADVGRHCHGVQDEVKPASEMLHGAVDECLQVRHGGGVRGDDDGSALLRKAVDLAQTDGYGSVGEDDFRAFSNGKLRDFPSYGLVIQSSEYQAFAAF